MGKNNRKDTNVTPPVYPSGS